MKRILLILLVALFQNFVFGATITSNGSGGNWNTASSWIGGVVPGAADDVVIASNTTIIVDGTRYAKTLNIRGILQFTTNNTSMNLPANGTINIVSPGKIENTGSCTNNREINIGGVKYAACQGNGNSDYTFAAVNTAGGNCPTSAGTISGNQYICRYGTMTTTFTSTVSGGTWSSSNSAIASVNATTGAVTATKPDDGVSRTATITYRVGGSGGCTLYTTTRDVYVANGPGAGPNTLAGSSIQCQGTTTTYTITPDLYSSSYLWGYEGGTGANIITAADGLSASVTFSSTATSGNIRVQSVNGCGNGGGGKYLYVTVNPAINAVPSATSATNLQCNYAQLNWNIVANATGYYLDIAKDSGFTNFVSGYNNFYVPGNNSSYGANNLPDGNLYYRVRAYNSCTTTINSTAVNFKTTAPLGGSVSPAQIICSGNSPTTNLTLSGNTTINSIITKWQRASDIGFTTNLANISETSNVLPVSKMGSITVNTYFRAVVELTSIGCVSYSAPVLITVNNSISSASSTPTVCFNTAIIPITHTTSGFTGIGTAINLPAGVTASFSGNIVTISGTPTVSGTFNYSIPLTGGSCPASNATGTIIVQSLFTSGAIASTGEIICSATVPNITIGSSTQASGGNNNITYQWQYSTDNTFSTGVTIINSNTATYKPTQSLTQTTYYRRLAKDSSCNITFTNSANTWVVTIASSNSISLSSAAGTDSQTKCINTVISNITYTTVGATGAAFSGLPGGVTGTWASNAVTISGTPTEAGIFNYTITLTGGCGTITKTGTIDVESVNPPVLGTITNTSCTTSTGSVELNGLPAGNWTLYRNGILMANGSGNTYLISGLTGGTHTFTVFNGNCTSQPSLPVNIIDLTNKWDGIKWSKTGDLTPPTSADKIVFEGNYVSSGNLQGCSCTVNSGNVIINSGHTLTITNSVSVNGGNLIFENDASLIQTTNAVNSGSIIYKRISSPMKNFDFSYWSSPVAGQTFVGLSPNTLSDKYMSYPGAGWAQETPSNIMKPGIGYIIRVPKPNFWPNPNAASYSQPVEFKGIPNNGDITNSQDMTPGKFYLIGNPYPSALDADEFLFRNVNNRSILNGTIYFWTHNTGITQSGSQYVYASNDYASYNLTGGTGTAASSPGNKTEPQGFIAAGQSFFASTKGTGKVEFNNSMRIAGSNSQFFKPGKTSKSTGLEKHRLWLNLTNEKGAYKQTLIGYVEGASNDFDNNFDGISFDGNSFVDFYSVNNTDNLTIQGRALPFKDTDEVLLGYRTTVAGDFTISINNADGALANQTVYLIDKQTNTINDLTAKNYTFNTAVGKFNDRFVLKYTNKTLATGDFEVTDDAVLVVTENKNITVKSSLENIENIFIYDISGKLLYKKEKIEDLQISIENLPSAQQILIVKVILQNGNTTTKKVIFK